MKKKSPFLFVLMSIFVYCAAAKNGFAQTTYKIGDVYDQNGVKGIVVHVDGSGLHGLVMSMKSSKEEWTSKEFFYETNAFSEDDGQKNMDAIASYVATGKATWENFPVMNWARSLGEGWYIPSKNEAEEIWKNLCGGTLEYKMSIVGRVNNDFTQFNKAQKKNGGDNLVNDGFAGDNKPCYWYTSTETENGMVYQIGISPDLKNMEVALNKKVSAYPIGKNRPAMSIRRSRAIHRF